MFEKLGHNETYINVNGKCESIPAFKYFANDSNALKISKLISFQKSLFPKQEL